MMACSMCSRHGLNGGIDANFARDVTLKRSIGQRYVGYSYHGISSMKLLMGPRTPVYRRTNATKFECVCKV